MFIQNRFIKYQTQGSDYHYQQINRFKPLTFNAYVLARYENHLNLLCRNIKKHFLKSNQLKILDLGCGDAVLLFLLKQRLKNYKLSLWGIDICEEALRVAKRKIPEGNFAKENICNLKFPDNAFDIVLSSDVIEHLKKQDKMLKEIKRVLKKEGITIIGTPIRLTDKPLDKYHVRELFPQEFKKMAEKYFNSAKIVQSHPLLYLMLYRHHFNFFGKKIFLFYLLINVFTIIFKINPFQKIVETKEKYFSYMFLVAEG